MHDFHANMLCVYIDLARLKTSKRRIAQMVRTPNSFSYLEEEKAQQILA